MINITAWVSAASHISYEKLRIDFSDAISIDLVESDLLNMIHISHIKLMNYYTKASLSNTITTYTIKLHKWDMRRVKYT